MKLLRAFPYEPTAKRIALFALLLSLIAQTILVWTGFNYWDKNNQLIAVNEKQGLNKFLQDNLTAVITNINNTMNMFETVDFRQYATSFMPLRSTETIDQQTKEWNDKIDALHLSPAIYKSVYLIGTDKNQMSFQKSIGQEGFRTFNNLNKDELDRAHVTEILLENKRKIIRFNHEELPMFPQASLSMDVKGFLDDTFSGNLVINNGNIGNVFVVFILQDNLFNPVQAIQSDMKTSIVISDSHGHSLWSGIAKSNLEALALKLKAGRFTYEGNSYAVSTHQLTSQPYWITYVNAGSSSVLQAILPFLAIILITLLFTFAISFIYAKRIFIPFRKISMAVRRQSHSDELQLKPLSPSLFKNKSRELSLKSKIFTIFVSSVLAPSLVSGLLYSYVLTQGINQTSNQFLIRISNLTQTTANTHVEMLESTINRLMTSQELQGYLTKYDSLLSGYQSTVSMLRQSFYNSSYYNEQEVNYASIAAFPGINNFSYIVLFDRKGSAIYSSLFSNNMKIFAIDKSLFRDTDSAYWLTDYVDISNRHTAAIIKRFPRINEQFSSAYYLLAVPKDDIFQTLEFGSSGFFVSNGQNQELFQFHRYSNQYTANLFASSYSLADTGLIATFQYPKEEFEAQYRNYFYRFLFVLIAVSLMSFLLAKLGSSLLSKPIERLKGSIDDIAKGHFNTLVEGSSKSEIGLLIENYNEMVQKINQLIQENMQILEENNQVKLKKKEMNTLKVKSELDMLQSQINPHFLYNTLEAINMKSIRYGMQDISAMIRTLAEMFRYSVGQGSVMVPLQKEIDHVKNFIAIHNMRIGHVVELDIDIPELLWSAAVLRFSFQPIVENSMKYAFAGYTEGAKIRIAAHSESGFLDIEILDNGIGMDDDRLEEVIDGLKSYDESTQQEQRTGIGLRNVHTRLLLHFPEASGLTISSELMGGTSVHMRLPFNE